MNVFYQGSPQHKGGDNFHFAPDSKFNIPLENELNQIKRPFAEPASFKFEFDREEVLECKQELKVRFTKEMDLSSLDGKDSASTHRMTDLEPEQVDQISSIHANFSDDLHEFAQDDKHSFVEEDHDASAKKRGRKKKPKIFSRRKDVIIKTLLRKCRKFFQKDFNKKTNYLKMKRKMDSSFYRKCLVDYIEKELNFPPSEDLVIFLGSLLYQPDLEKAIDSFVSPTFDSLSIRKELDTVHEILYKYSHEKFRSFSRRSDFATFFSVYYNTGAEDERVDNEYSEGLEIIKEQLAY